MACHVQCVLGSLLGSVTCITGKIRDALWVVAASLMEVMEVKDTRYDAQNLDESWISGDFCCLNGMPSIYVCCKHCELLILQYFVLLQWVSSPSWGLETWDDNNTTHLMFPFVFVSCHRGCFIVMAGYITGSEVILGWKFKLNKEGPKASWTLEVWFE